MKKLKLFVCALIVGTTSLIASNGNNEAAEKFQLENQNMNLVSSSNLISGNEPNVKLTFSINSESEIVVLAVNSENNDIF